MTLLVAAGNTLRRDDGVAHAVAGAFEDALHVHQLNPELAAEIAACDNVVFLDAAIDADDVTVEPVGPDEGSEPLTHASTPARVAALSRELFGFKGTAWVCRLPVEDMSAGEGLSPRARQSADRAIHLIRSGVITRS